MPLLIVALGVVLLLVLILFKVKPVYALPIVSIAVGVAEGLSFAATVRSAATGIWITLYSTALILCLGAMLGKVIEISGAALQITNTLIGWFGKRHLKWGVMLTGLIVGIPMFYNAGFVILVPLIFSIASSAQMPVLLVGIPMVASLSVTHGFLPPHPGPTAIAQMFSVAPGKVMVLGLILAIPTVILAGPLFSSLLGRLNVSSTSTGNPTPRLTVPSAPASFLVALLPVFIISITTLFSQSTNQWTEFLGNPSVALGLTLLLALTIFQQDIQKSFNDQVKMLADAVKEILMILLIIAMGGGFKEVLIDSGVSNYVKEFASGMNYSPLLLAWCVAALLRVSIGSATVAGLTTAGIMLPLISLPGVKPELMVLAIGSGSLMFSHINDTGFWMFKEYFNLTLKQTFLSWTMMETIVSISGLIGVLILNQLI
ncbi:MAG TPA: gluconate:H+ symporter [Cyclobacteriaceae bacterium]|jgi:gluconate transporter|nr:gluconate:H+ symporter [Cyclobacteriaceae bacterium]